ncbi:hypothetical protein PVK06_036809 [Gossypium arboreum]|uniref:Bifunctional inhibitor/plant lipid transfer protein/seed storage helical domain-containing protein n=1 Tax=Gossypium arboreum TaxID=29729 RepID=A0ABR0NKK2_GOSAR|nr:hypothetical protein PVK06_036809 [Gossypium arboreum]
MSSKVSCCRHFVQPCRRLPSHFSPSQPPPPLASLSLLTIDLIGISSNICGFNRVDAMSKYYSHCRKHEIEKEAQKLFPCGYAAKFIRAPVSEHCCAVMEKKLDNPNCVCGLFFSRMAHKAGFRPEVTLTIPKRCNIALRPVGQLFTRRLFIYLCMKRMISKCSFYTTVEQLNTSWRRVQILMANRSYHIRPEMDDTAMYSV